MKEKQLTERESLELISQMIHEGKNYFHESGAGSLLGGFGVLLCSLLAFAQAKGWSFPFNPFYLLIPVFAGQVYLSGKEEKKKVAKTFTDEAIDFIWIGFFISVLMAVVAGSLAGLGYVTVSISLFLFAFAAFCTGLLAKFTYLVVAAGFCFLLAATSLFLQNEYTCLLLAATAILVWVIPGFMMNAYLKTQAHGR